MSPDRPSTLVPIVVAILVTVAACREKAVPVEELYATRTLAMNQLQRGQLAAAESGFKKLIALAPDDPLGYANLGLTYLQGGRFADAEKQLQRARKLDPRNTDVRMRLARLFALTNRREEARALLEEARGADPKDAHALYALASLDSADASPAAQTRRIARLRELLGVSPGNLAGRLELADALVRTGDADGAVQQLEELRRLPPEPPAEAGAAIDAAIQSLRARRLDEARTSVDQLARVLVLTPPYQMALAQVRWVEGPIPGTPTLTFAPATLVSSRGVREQPVVDSVRFADASDDSGLLDALGRPAAGAGGASAVAIGDVDGDGNDEILMAVPAAPVPVVRLVGMRGGFARDLTTRTRLALPNGASAAAFGDWDNDGWMDLFAVGSDGHPHLFRNKGDGTYEDATARAQLGDVNGARRATFADLDHDGDLDLLVVGARGRQLFRNNLDGTFTDATASMGLAGGGVDVAFADLNDDGRLDLAIAGGSGADAILLNGGALRFADAGARSGVATRGSTAVAVGDYDDDGDFDLLFAGTGGAEPTLWTNDGRGAFSRDARSAVALRALRDLDAAAAEFVDYDNDGALDVVVTGRPKSSGARGVRLLRNVGAGRFEDRSALLPQTTPEASSLAASDVDDDGDLDLVLAGAGGARLLRNDGGNHNMALRVQLKGLRTGSGKNNDFGIGSRLEVSAGALRQTRVATGRVTYFGLGPHLKADVLRVEWPNGVPQTVFLPGTDRDVVEVEMLKGSCAFAYTWDGKRFRFVTDVMWRSALGMPMGLMGGSRAFAPAGASQEYLRIPGEALKPRDGRYLLQLTEELWETAYADEVKLLAVDHPDSVDVFTDERFVPPGPVALRLYHASERRAPLSAVDGRGADVLPALRAHDDAYVTNLVPTRYQGVVAPHEIVLDLGPGAGARGTYLFLRGWIYPTDASINVALSQQPSVHVAPPSFEVRDARGRWVTVVPSLGFPSGKDKMMVIDLAGRFPTADHHVRIRTSMQIYWDEAFVARDADRSPVRVTTLAPVKADLHARGFSRVYRRGGRYGPYWFDYDSVTRESPWRPITGSYTRFGDVRPLLERGDDMYVIMAPGDETTIEFDANATPALPPGWRRDFLLYTDGWIKDSDLNTAHGTTVDPLPYHAIDSYPYGARDAYPRDEAHQRYLREYNTRTVSGRRAR